MVYHLRILALGHGAGIKITEQEYSSIVVAMQRIYIARDFEEKLDILLENFAEYERDLLDLAVRHSIFPLLDDDRINLERQLINRRVTNLLSSARMYLDQVKHSFSKLFSERPDLACAGMFSGEYDRTLEYRVAEALRNFSQHRALPVHIMSWPLAWEEVDTEDQRLRFSVVPAISIEELRAEGGFKTSVLEELQRLGQKKISLTRVLRRYVECLTSVHMQMRTTMAGEIEQDYELVARTIERARGEFGDRLVGLAVSKGTDPAKTQEHHFVNSKSRDRRDFLLAKSASFGKFSRRFASAEYPGDVA